jgi:hypothetical protein
MVRRRSLPGERYELYSPIGLIPTDTFTGQSPLGRLRPLLDERDSAGQWHQTEIKAVRTPGGIVAYPGLRRSRNFEAGHARVFRVRLEADFYLPLYVKTAGGTLDGIEFTVFPYNDTHPPANYPKLPAEFPDYLKEVLRKVWLVPAPNYPFPGQVFVLRGAVLRAGTGQPVTGAEVIWGNKEKALTAERGEFGLPLRVTDKKHITDPQKIDARDPRTNQQGSKSVIIPNAVGINQIITVS